MRAQATTSVKLDPDVKDRMQRLASSRHSSTHKLMIEAIEQYIEREELRHSARQEALSAWEGYQATGLHVTGAEADAWLAKLEAGDNSEPPECHV
ncbi:MAG: ribbon-helix-helix protein, CopG family [Asticcacaulis sp.]